MNINDNSRPMIEIALRNITVAKGALQYAQNL